MKREYTPLYLRIKSDIISKISLGELKKGDRLPAERELAESLGVSRITVVGALKELAAEGIIRKIRGSGSFISCEKLDENYEDIFSQITGRAKVEITFGLRNGEPQYELMIKTLAGLFQLENPDIKVKVENIRIPYHEQDDVYLLRIGSGEAPMVGEFFLHADYAVLNGLVPLENLPGFQCLAAALHPRCVYETPDAGGGFHIHALPSRISTRTVLVNADLLHRAGVKDVEGPLDRELLLEWASVAGEYTREKQSGEYGVFAEIPVGWHGVVGQLPYLWTSDVKFPNSIGGFKTLLESASCKAGIGFLSDIIRTGNQAPVDGMDLFAGGRVGIVLSGGTWPLFLNKLMVPKFSMKAFVIPSEDKNVDAPSVMGNYCLGIFRSAVKSDMEIEAAWKWIKYLLRKKQQYWIASSDLSFPALRNVPCALEREFPELAPVFLKALTGSIPQFDCRNIRKAMTLFGSELKKCFTGEVSAAECVENSVRNISQLEFI